MIPEHLVDFIHGPNVSWVGSRNEQLRPSLAWAFGARVDAENALITAFVPDIEAEPVKANLTSNRKVAFTVADGVSHEAYQFKGELVEMRPTTDEERAVQDIHLSKVISRYTMFPDALFPGYVLYPSTAITFRVDEAFVQTPGPGAGDKLDLAAGSA